MTEEDQQDFRRFFPELEFHAKDLLGVSVCALDREVLWQGKLFWSNTYLCFHAHIFLKVARVIIQWKDVLKLEKRLMGGIIPSAIRVITLHSRFTFGGLPKRDATFAELERIWGKEMTLKAELQEKADQNSTAVIPASDEDLSLDMFSNKLDFVTEQIPTRDVLNIDVLNSQDSLAVSNSVELSHTTIGRRRQRMKTKKPNIEKEKEFSPDNLPTEPVSCGCTDHYQTLVLDQIIVGPNVHQLFSYMFKQEGFQIMEKIHKIRGNDSFSFVPWSEATVNDLTKMKKFKRTLSYNVAFKPPFLPVSLTPCFEDQEYFAPNPFSYVCNLSTKTPKIPFGDCFVIYNKYCLTHESSTSARLRATLNIEFSKALLWEGKIKTGALEGTLAYLNEVISQFSKIEWAKISSGEISKPLILSGGDPVVHSSSEHTALLHVLNNYTSSLFDSNSSYSILFEYIVVIIFLLMLICTFWLLKVNDKHDDKRAIAFNQKYIQKTENIDVQMALIMKQIIKRVRILRQSDVLMDGYE